jgi:hypothetical protein
MQFLKSAVTGISNLLAKPRASNDLDESMEEVRQLMLDALGDAAGSIPLRLSRRILQAQDTQTLWDLRGQLMAVIAQSRGERAAREVMLQVSEEFRGLLPPSMATRPSPLA